MTLEMLSKAELASILEDKQIVLEMLGKEAGTAPKMVLAQELVNAMLAARCRLCVGHIVEEVDEHNPVGKVTKAVGQPIAISQGGDKIACRTCRHVRSALWDFGVRDVYI
jgi:hypothetical protein